MSSLLSQKSVEQSVEEINAMDLIIEFTVHHNLTASACQALSQISSKDLYKLRRCTLKSLVIFYAQTVIFEDDKNKLIDALSILEKVFDDDQNKTKHFAILKKGIKYQIVIHHLQTCGPQSARTIIDKYFPQSGSKQQVVVRNKLIGFCDDVQNDKPHQKGPIKWKKFKNWTRDLFDAMLKHCQRPKLEKIMIDND